MIVTLISPSYLSSTTAPKIIFALGSAMLVTISLTRFTSCNVRSFPPVMLYTMPVARSMERSINCADVAASAAYSARFFPLDTPTPNIAVPLLVIMACTIGSGS